MTTDNQEWTVIKPEGFENVPGEWLVHRKDELSRVTTDNPNPSKIEQLSVKIGDFVYKINQDLQISTPSKLFNSSKEFPGLKQIIENAPSLPGFSTLLGLGPFSDMIANAAEKERLLTTITAITGSTPDVVKEFYQTHSYSLEFIEAAVRAGAKLDEEDIKRTMEERVTYKYMSFGENLRPSIVSSSKEDNHTFLVILPDNDRRHIQAAYMEVDGGSLYFEDDNRETILAFGPGHWVWAERVERSAKEEVYRDLRDYEPTKLSKMDDAGLWESTDNGETWKLVITARDSQNPT